MAALRIGPTLRRAMLAESPFSAPCATLFVMAVAVAACSTGPEDPSDAGSIHVAFNSVVTGSHATTDTTAYHITVDANQFFSLQLEVMTGQITLSIYKAGSTGPLASLTSAADGRPLESHSTAPISTVTQTDYRLLATGSGSYRFRLYSNPASPERIHNVVAIGDTVEGEDLHRPGDMDEFFFQGEAGDELIGYLDIGRANGVGVLEVAASSGRLEVANAYGTGEALGRFTSDRFVLPASGLFRVRVWAGDWDPVTFVGPYSFQIRRIERRPESSPATLAVNDTTFTEGLDYVGDIDEFHLQGPPGENVNVLFRVTTGDRASPVLAQVLDVIPLDEPLIVQSTTQDTLLTDRGVGRFVLPASGEAVLRVSAEALAPVRGTYELRVFRIDPRPESMPALLVPSDSAHLERLELPGDIDEFALSLPQDDTLNILLQADSTSWWVKNGEASIGFEFLPAAASSGLRALTAAPIQKATGPFAAQRGDYVLRVFGLEGRVKSYFGGYRLWVYRIQSAVEDHNGTVSIGETVTSTLDPLGDQDVFRLLGAPGDRVEVVANGLGGEGQDLLLRVNAGSGGTSSIALSVTDRTGPITLGQGALDITVSSGNLGTSWTGRGPYRFTVVRVTSSTPSAPSGGEARRDRATERSIP